MSVSFRGCERKRIDFGSVGPDDPSRRPGASDLMRHLSRRNASGGALAAASAALLAAVLASTGGASHIPGATYRGTDVLGGELSLVVSADGLQVTEFELHTCGELFRISTQPAAIVDHSFAWQATPPHLLGSFFTGTFSGEQTAAGTLKMSNIFGCQSGTLAWTARTTSPPPQPPPSPPPPVPPKPACVVPNLLGKTLTKARATLSSANCSLGGVRRAYSDAMRRGRVAAQKPRPRTRLPNGGKVQVTVSLGRRP